MVNIIPNWANITGEVISVSADETQPDMHSVKIKVLSNKDHESFPNLVKPDADGSIILQLKKDDFDAGKLVTGGTVGAKIRAAQGGKYFAGEDGLKVL